MGIPVAGPNCFGMLEDITVADINDRRRDW